jgi:hypothetical protein
MDALAELDVLEGAHIDPRIRALQEAWNTALTKVEKGTIEADVSRSEVLTTAYQKDNLTTRQIELAINVCHAYVIHLLRYNRFLVAVATKIPEGRFRAYWAEIADPYLRTRDKAIRDEHEQSVFAAINQRITAGQPPQPHPRHAKKVTSADIHGKKNPLRAFKKEAKHCYSTTILPTLKELERLAHTDRSSYAPIALADQARILRQAMTQLFDLMVDPTQE